MQTNKTIIRLVVLLVLLGSAVGLQRWLAQRNTQDTQSYQDYWGTIEVSSVETVNLSRAEDSLEMTQENDRWESEDIRLNTLLVQDLISSLINPSSLQPVAKTSAQHQSFEVTEDAATVVIFSTSNEQKKVFVGNPASGNYYIRVDGSETVYLIDSLPYQVTSPIVADWVDKELLAVDKAALQALRINRGGQTIALEQREGQWFQAGSQQALDEAPLSEFFTNLQSLMSQGLVSAEVENVYPANSTVQLEIEAQNMPPVELEFFPGAEDVAVTVSDRSGTYLLSTSVFETFLIQASDLRPAPEPTATE